MRCTVKNLNGKCEYLLLVCFEFCGWKASCWSPSLFPIRGERVEQGTELSWDVPGWFQGQREDHQTVAAASGPQLHQYEFKMFPPFLNCYLGVSNNSEYPGLGKAHGLPQTWTHETVSRCFFQRRQFSLLLCDVVQRGHYQYVSCQGPQHVSPPLSMCLCSLS